MNSKVSATSRRCRGDIPDVQMWTCWIHRCRSSGVTRSLTVSLIVCSILMSGCQPEQPAPAMPGDANAINEITKEVESLKLELAHQRKQVDGIDQQLREFASWRTNAVTQASLSNALERLQIVLTQPSAPAILIDELLTNSILFTNLVAAQSVDRQVIQELVKQTFAYASTKISPDSRDYTPIKTPHGTFLVITESVNPHLDGYTLTLLVGNLLPVEVTQSEIEVSWPPANADNLTPKKSTTVRMGNLRARAWNRTTINMLPATLADVRNATVTLTISGVSLEKPKDN